MVAEENVGPRPSTASRDVPIGILMHGTPASDAATEPESRGRR